MTIVLVSGDLREPALSLEERRDDLIRQLDAAPLYRVEELRRLLDGVEAEIALRQSHSPE